MYVYRDTRTLDTRHQTLDTRHQTAGEFGQGGEKSKDTALKEIYLMLPSQGIEMSEVMSRQAKAPECKVTMQAPYIQCEFPH